MSGYNIKELVQEAHFRWLWAAEVLFILQNYEETQLKDEPPQKPPSGSLLLFNKRVLRNFRNDGHNWQKKKDGKNVAESHGHLKVGNDEALNCYYARSEDRHIQRRSYWMLNSAMEHIVLVHYRDTTIGKHGAGPISALTLGSSNIIQSCNNYTSSGVLTNSNGASRSSLTGRIDEIDSSPAKDGSMIIPHVQYTPEVSQNVLSYDQLEEQGYTEYFECIDPKDECSLVNGLEDLTWGRNDTPDYVDEEYISWNGSLYALKVNSFPRFISFMNLLKKDSLVYKNREIFSKKYVRDVEMVLSSLS